MRWRLQRSHDISTVAWDTITVNLCDIPAQDVEEITAFPLWSFPMLLLTVRQIWRVWFPCLCWQSRGSCHTFITDAGIRNGTETHGVDLDTVTTNMWIMVYFAEMSCVSTRTEDTCLPGGGCWRYRGYCEPAAGVESVCKQRSAAPAPQLYEELCNESIKHIRSLRKSQLFPVITQTF